MEGNRMDSIQVTTASKREREYREAGFKFSQIIRQGFGNPFWDYRDPCGLGSLMARYHTEPLFDNRQILLFMNAIRPSSQLHRRLFSFSLSAPPLPITGSSHVQNTCRTRTHARSTFSFAVSRHRNKKKPCFSFLRRRIISLANDNDPRSIKQIPTELATPPNVQLY